MDVSNFIQFGALLVALVSLIWQQRRLVTEEQRKEKRIETKLRIFYALYPKDLTEQDIIQALERGQPLSETDKAEVRKSLYEMLTDETIRFTKEGSYKPRRRTGRDEA
jgi:hypothetical protein